MSVAFEGIDRLVVTFLAGDVTAGKPVVMGGEGSVKNASSGQMPVGVALHARDGHAAVQLKGLRDGAVQRHHRPGAGLDGAGGRQRRLPAGRRQRRERPDVPGGDARQREEDRGLVPVRTGERKETVCMAYQYETVKLDKGMYSEAGRSFTKVLEQCDPSEQYKGTPLEHLDAFQRQLKRFDIRVKGSESDVVAKFFATWESAVLFPEYVARAVRQGMEETDILPQITAAETRVSGMDYRSIASTPGDEAKELKRVEEGAVIPETRVKAQENLVRLHKRGRMLVASYEAIQFQRLDLFSVTLRQIGAYINRMHAADAIDVLMNGDGNDNAAQVFTVGSGPISGTAGALSYDALVDFWSQFAPYALNTLVVGDAMADILKLKEMQDGTAGLTFQGTGKLVTPMGATLVRSSAVPAGTILGLDKNYALELVRASDVLVEYDKLIDRQLERAAITSISGFAKIFQDAAKVLKLGG